MKALTLWRPWSDAIVRGPKRVENREWAPPKHVFGEVIALHAGRTFADPAAKIIRLVWPGVPAEPQSPQGIVGVARVIGVASNNANLIATAPGFTDARVRELLFRDGGAWFSGRFGWVLDEVVAIEAIPCRGAQGLWDVPADVLPVLEQRVVDAARAA